MGSPTCPHGRQAPLCRNAALLRPMMLGEHCRDENTTLLMIAVIQNPLAVMISSRPPSPPWMFWLLCHMAGVKNTAQSDRAASKSGQAFAEELGGGLWPDWVPCSCPWPGSSAGDGHPRLLVASHQMHYRMRRPSGHMATAKLPNRDRSPRWGGTGCTLHAESEAQCGPGLRASCETHLCQHQGGEAIAGPELTRGDR